MENLLLFVNIGVKKSIFRAFFNHDFQVLNRIENLGSNSFALMYISLKLFKYLLCNVQ